MTGEEISDVAAALGALETRLASHVAVQGARIDAIFDAMERVVEAAGLSTREPPRVLTGGGKPGRRPWRRPELTVVRGAR
ncbi:MAG TPA: hypothetical protein VMV92_16750 [Streptosporangiaceae bacterium]|nr:hypothetical protein [Streptosporangiaceae bacterium]HVB43671.1 hypothetical protein [Streptosporangiaceae bacterium]